MSEKLTPAQRRALTWLRENEPVSMFPLDGIAPSLRFTKHLEKLGLVERVGKTTSNGTFLGGGFTLFGLTERARSMLAGRP